MGQQVTSSHHTIHFICIMVYTSFSSVLNHKAVVTREMKLFKDYFSLCRRLSEITLFRQLAENYFKIISQDYCSSRIFSNVFNVAEIILK